MHHWILTRLLRTPLLEVLQGHAAYSIFLKLHDDLLTCRTQLDTTEATRTGHLRIGIAFHVCYLIPGLKLSIVLILVAAFSWIFYNIKLINFGGKEQTAESNYASCNDQVASRYYLTIFLFHRRSTLTSPETKDMHPSVKFGEIQCTVRSSRLVSSSHYGQWRVRVVEAKRLQLGRGRMTDYGWFLVRPL